MISLSLKFPCSFIMFKLNGDQLCASIFQSVYCQRKQALDKYKKEENNAAEYTVF